MSLSEILDALVRGVPATLTITFGSLAVGAVVAAVIVLARLSSGAPARGLATAYVDLVRGIPPIVWLFIIFFGIGQGAFQMSAMFAGIAGLGLVTSAYLSEMYRAGIASVPRGQWDAARTVGLGGVRTFRSIIAPQAVPVIVPPVATYAIGLLKDSALVSVLGAQDVTFRAYQLSQNTLDGLDIFLVTALIYIALSLPIALFARWVNARLASHLVP